MAPAVADLVRLIAELEERKINFESLTEKIATRSPAGRLVFHVFTALAMSLLLEDADRELLASVLMNGQEELAPELWRGTQLVGSGHRKRVLEELQQRVKGLESRKDVAARAQLAEERLRLKRALRSLVGTEAADCA